MAEELVLSVQHLTCGYRAAARRHTVDARDHGDRARLHGAQGVPHRA